MLGMRGLIPRHVAIGTNLGTAGEVSCLRIDGYGVDHADDGTAAVRLLSQYVPHGLEAVADGGTNLGVQM